MKKKVLMIGPLDIQGGMSTVMKNYMESSIMNEQFDVTYISSATEGNCYKKLSKMIEAFKISFLELKNNKIDLVHIHAALDASIYRKGVFIYLSKMFKSKVILHFHASDLDDFLFLRCNNLTRKIVKCIFKRSDIVISLNESMKKLLKERLNIDSSILYNFTNNKAQNLYNPSSKNILMLSRMSRNKGVYEAINVMIDLKESDLKLVLAGDGPELDEIREYVKKQGIEDKVIFAGWVDDKNKKQLFKDCYVSILPSHFEGVPMSILESLSFGVPVIASQVGGIPEIISENEGFLHQVKDESQLRNLLETLRGNDDLKRKLSNNCISKYKNVFTEEKHIKSLSDIYNS